MSMEALSVLKVEGVLEIVRKDRRFMNDMSRDPARTLAESGIDLSPGEIIAIVDVVNDTSVSTIAPKLKKARGIWKDIKGSE